MIARSSLSQVFGAFVVAAVLAATSLVGPSAQAQAPARKPNILVIMGDDVGWFNVGAYHRGIMSGKTPNLAGCGRHDVHRLLR
jgi:hypothetical protein